MLLCDLDFVLPNCGEISMFGGHVVILLLIIITTAQSENGAFIGAEIDMGFKIGDFLNEGLGTLN